MSIAETPVAIGPWPTGITPWAAECIAKGFAWAVVNGREVSMTRHGYEHLRRDMGALGGARIGLVARPKVWHDEMSQ